jgi:hypothetical protein
MIILYAGREGIFPYPAHGADPVIRDVLKCRTRLDAAAGIALLRVVNITAYIAYVFLHL